MRSVRWERSFLYAPVTAISSGPQFICFSISNRVLAASVHRFNLRGERDLDLRLLTELPHGAVITALEQHVIMHNFDTNVETLLIIGSGDCIFVISLCKDEKCCRTFSAQMLEGNLSRILRICSLGPGAGVLVITAINSAHVLSEEALLTACMSMEERNNKGVITLNNTSSKTGGNNGGNNITTPVTTQHYAVAGLGVALAADAVMEAEKKSVAIFSGTYAGSIAVWRLPLVTNISEQKKEEKNEVDHNTLLAVVSWIKAHPAGCAVFSVKVICGKSCGTAGHLTFYVATCSDDRTVTLHTPSSPTTTLTDEIMWSCCWRGMGPSFFRRRVFDVSMHFITEKDDDVIYLATGCEDGGVHVFAFPAKQLAVLSEKDAPALATPLTVVKRRQQHDGRGVYRVALVFSDYDTTKTTTNLAAAVISCGFDGSVYHTPFLPHLYCRKTTLLRPGSRRKRHVRGVVCDDEGVLLACTENELIVSPFSFDVWEEKRFPISIAEENRDLPSCISVMTTGVLGSSQFQQKRSSFVMLGTTKGNVYGMWYKLQLPMLLKQQEIDEDNEARVHCGVVLLFSLVSKVIFVKGLFWQKYILICSIHANKRLFLSALDWHLKRSVVQWAMCEYLGGSTITFLDVSILSLEEHIKQNEKRLEHICVVVGDDSGSISIDIIDLNDDLHTTTNLLHQQRLFELSIASISREGMNVDGEFVERLTVVSVQGEWRVLILNPTAQRVDICAISSPLRLPWRLSSVLAYSNTIAVTLFGTDIAVYTRRSSWFTWSLVAEYHDVKAPRLLSATIFDSHNLSDAPTAFVCHCSDGVHAEWYKCDALTMTRLCHGGNITGREYNTALFLPGPAPSFLCGCENSLLTLLPFSHATAAAIGAPLTLAGPHDSNILATAFCGWSENGDAVRFVTVGGLARVALWELSARHGCCLVGELGQLQEQWPAGDNSDHNNDNTTSNSVVGDYKYCCNLTECRAVPRFLSVCVTLQDIVVGGSDGVLRAFYFDKTPLQLHHTMFISTLAPKPILAAATLSADQRLVLSGDTNGVVAVCNVAEGIVMTTCLWGKAAVNAVAVKEQVHLLERTAEGNDALSTSVAWHALAAIDSGDVVLLNVTMSSITVLSTVRIGLTSVRCVSWIPGTDGGNITAVALNNERVVCLQTCVAASKTGSMEWALCVVGHTRVNIRDVSGLAVATATAMTGHMIIVVGEGVEAMMLNFEGDFLQKSIEKKNI